MSNDLKVVDRRNDLEDSPQADNFLAVVERLSMRPDIPVEKIKQIMDMQEHILDRNAEQAFNSSMVRVQNKLKTIPRDKKNEQTQSMYSRLETIVKLASPIYTEEGFSLTFYEGETSKENHIRVMVDVMHEQGHTKSRYADFAVDTTGIKGSVNKTLIHGEGSTFSYGRRYLTCMVFNIPTGDDNDGQGVGVEYITEEQLRELTDMKDNIKTLNMPKFLEYLKVESLEKIPAKQFMVAKMALQTKLNAEAKQNREPGEDG